MKPLLTTIDQTVETMNIMRLARLRAALVRMQLSVHRNHRGDVLPLICAEGECAEARALLAELGQEARR